MQIAEQSWLGTKAELTSLCAEADKYGIKIICDIVSNHFGNQDEGGANALSSQVTSMRTATATPRRSFRVMFPAALTSTQAIPMCRMLSSASSRI